VKKYFAVVFTIVLLAAGAQADILLTTPEVRRATLGSSATVSYDRFRVTQILIRPQANTVTVSFEVFVSTSSAKPPIGGTYTIDATALTASLSVPDMGFSQVVAITAAQGNSVTTNIAALKSQLETSAVNFGLVAGTVQ
jgi:hypothetical protein